MLYIIKFFAIYGLVSLIANTIIIVKDIKDHPNASIVRRITRLIYLPLTAPFADLFNL